MTTNKKMMKSENPAAGIVVGIEAKTNRVYAFIDASNLYYGAKEQKYRIDFRKLACYFRTRYGVSRTFYYTGLNATSDKQLSFYARLERYGYEMRYVMYKAFGNGDSKADVDARMATDLITSAETYDQAIVITGDGDFFWTLQYLMMSGKEIKLFGYATRTARELKRLVGSDFRDMVNIFPALDTMKEINNAADTVMVSAAGSTGVLYTTVHELSMLYKSPVDNGLIRAKRKEIEKLVNAILYGNENGAPIKDTPHAT